MTGRPQGLRRFAAPAKPEPQPEPEPTGAVQERCEMCGTDVGPRHGHVVDLDHRSIVCACRACYLLFTHDTATTGRYRSIPERYLQDPIRPPTPTEWEELQIPVGTAFFLTSTRADNTEVAAFYPSPAGATECLLDLDAWARMVTTHPLLAMAQPDVEAIVIRCTDTDRDCFLVPIDACYELVGRVRMFWQGFDGGAEARTSIEEFFADLRTRAAVFVGGG